MFLNDDQTQLANDIAERLIARGETLAVAESTTGGLVSAALLAVAGASRYFAGGGVLYTRDSRIALVG
ncbi:MAG: CinA family protein, partial [Chloroflexi bacterium]|nr:CinA family protein [Chloroflexota bacterium]